MNLRTFQDEHAKWSQSNFGATPSHQPLLGVVEEAGEFAEALGVFISASRLSHSHLKREQGIRGTDEEHVAAIKDSIGDIIIFLTDYCNKNGFCLEDIVAETWQQVSQRNWKENPYHGKV